MGRPEPACSRPAESWDDETGPAATDGISDRWSDKRLAGCDEHARRCREIRRSDGPGTSRLRALSADACKVCAKATSKVARPI